MLVDDIKLSLLFRCLSEKRWRNLSREDFTNQFCEEVSDLDDLVICTHVVDKLGTVYELSNGLAILEHNDKWSLFESEARYREREHFRLWAEFARGHWTDKVPQEAGFYFVKDRDQGKRHIRELRKVNGRLKDVSGGQVRVGKISEWAGWWYLPAIPPLRD